MELVTITLTAPAKIGGQRYREGDTVDVSPGLAAQLRRDGLVRDRLIGGVAVADIVREGQDRARLRELEAEVAAHALLGARVRLQREPADDRLADV
ncbi:MAG: hypothetical protein CMO30_06490, partial [Tistrella sp.]|nr:hypothetical protein [Tistrella sp.]